MTRSFTLNYLLFYDVKKKKREGYLPVRSGWYKHRTHSQTSPCEGKQQKTHFTRAPLL